MNLKDGGIIRDKIQQTMCMLMLYIIGRLKIFKGKEKRGRGKKEKGHKRKRGEVNIVVNL